MKLSLYDPESRVKALKMNFVSPFDAMCWDFFPWILEVTFMSEVEHLPKCISLQSEMILDLASL
jgi:hypothetical protein